MLAPGTQQPVTPRDIGLPPLATPPASCPLSTVLAGFLRLRRNHHFTVPLEDKMATTRTTTSTLTVEITPNDKGNPPGKLADAELHFGDGPLAGLKLIGFAIWERRGGTGRNVTFPARSYAVNGERRSFALLRPVVDTTAQERVRALILEVYAQQEREMAGTR